MNETREAGHEYRRGDVVVRTLRYREDGHAAERRIALTVRLAAGYYVCPACGGTIRRGELHASLSRVHYCLKCVEPDGVEVDRGEQAAPAAEDVHREEAARRDGRNRGGEGSAQA